MRSVSPFALLLVALLSGSPAARAADPTAGDILKKYDEIMGPPAFEAQTEMVAHRDDDSERAYRMKVLKSGDERFRLWFQEPAAVRGQEMLRQGENSWLYMPNLKRSVRMANRDSFQGGDFNNADVLRVNYQADYEPTLVPDPAMPDAWLVELKAKTTDAAYDKVRLWVSRKDLMPLKGEYYTASGKMLRSAEFLDVKDFGGGYRRPAKVVMKNMLATKRYSTMVFTAMNPKVAPANARFVLDDLGR